MREPRLLVVTAASLALVGCFQPTWTKLEPGRPDLPAFVDLSPKDRIVYLGEIRVRRGPGRRAEFVNAMDGARPASAA